MNTPPAEYPIRRHVVEGVVIPNMHFEVCLRRSVVCQNSFIPSTKQLINQRLHEHTHIIARVFRNYQRQEYILTLEDGAMREIEGDNKYGPTSIRCSPHTVRIEPISCERDTYITSLNSFLRISRIKIGPCLSIRWMYQLVRVVTSPFFMSCHLFRGFFSHVQSLYPRYKRKVP